MRDELSVQTLYDEMAARLALEWIAGRAGGHRQFSRAARGNPTLVGHLNLIHPNQLQVLGNTEVDYLLKLRKNSLHDTYDQLFKNHCVLVIAAGVKALPPKILEQAERSQIALFRSRLAGSEIINNLRYYFSHKLAEKTTLHGVFMEVLSVGVLLTGDSGVGKSELALELISRGHRLIADDAPEFARITPDIINGTCPPVLQDFLEVRGLGILNIRSMYGDSSIKAGKYLRLIIGLKHQTEHAVKDGDRLSSRKQITHVLGLEIPVITVPVAPGRNLAVLVEAAVRNHQLRQHGYIAGEDLATRQRRLISAQVAEE